MRLTKAKRGSGCAMGALDPDAPQGGTPLTILFEHGFRQSIAGTT